MIAYNYRLKFIPELTNDIAVEEAPFAGEIIIRESKDRSVREKLVYELPFFNNQGRDISLYTEREFDRTQKDQLWAFVVKGVITFFWRSGRLTLEYLPEEKFTPELLKYWCLHSILPIFFTVEERYNFFHAGAVTVNGKTILFIADSCGGKSTLTDFFIRRGHPMISDDKVAICENNGELLAVPSHPHYRPHRGQEDLGFFTENFSTQPKPIRALYELEKVEEGAAVAITELKGVDKFVILCRSSEMDLHFLESKQFVYFGQIATSLPVFKVTVPWRFDRLPEVYRTIANHSRSF